MKKNKVTTKQARKTKAVRQATFRQKSAATGQQRWEVLVSGSEKIELKKLLADIRKATTGSLPAAAPAATTGSLPKATTGSNYTPGEIDAMCAGLFPKPATTGSTQPATTGSVPKATSGSVGVDLGF